MKVLLALVLSLSGFNSFAAAPSAVKKLTSYIAVGQYVGTNDAGSACSVTIGEVNYPKKDIQVRVIDENSDLTKLVVEGSQFGYKDYKKEFVQIDQNQIGSDDTNYSERVVRTTIAGENKLYVVVSFSTVLNRESQIQVAECVVDL